jgi:hypothetical protein
VFDGCAGPEDVLACGLENLWMNPQPDVSFCAFDIQPAATVDGDLAAVGSLLDINVT